jgi:hypothetical protein
MGRPDGRIEKGQRLSSAISAKAWNRAQEAADRVLGAGTGFSVDDALASSSRLVLPMQISGPDFGPGCVVSYNRGTAISFKILDGNAYADVQCLQANVYEAINGSSTTYPYGTAFGVTLASGKNLSVVPVVVSGYAICKINIISANHQFAKAAIVRSTGENAAELLGCLESTDCGCDGTAKVLFYGTGSGNVRWSMVIL